MIVDMWTLADVERAVRTSWGLDTCDPVDRADWHVDLTREQFRPEESVVGGQVVQRPDGPPRRCREEYELLRGRVLAQFSPVAS